MHTDSYSDGVWLVAFDSQGLSEKDGNPRAPLCMAALELHTGQILRYGRSELREMGKPPFPVGKNTLFVAYSANAAIGCFIALGWPVPTNVLDLFAEFRWHTNGRSVSCGNGFVGALAYFGLSAGGAGRERFNPKLRLASGGWGSEVNESSIDRSDADVLALARLLSAMQSKFDWPRALLRGQYACAVATIERTGIPVDTETLFQLEENWERIRQSLISVIDRGFGVYDGPVFKQSRFSGYLQRNGLAWPRRQSGELDLQDETFKTMAAVYPQIAPLYSLRCSLSRMNLFKLNVGDDGRNRCELSIFSSKTGRNQPSTSRFIFGPAVWLRSLIKPREGCGLAFVDWCQQEHGIAAALSNDAKMIAAYRSGDPYLAFAKQAGAAPLLATKQSHRQVREQFKTVSLAMQYGMGAESLAFRLGQPVARARELLAMHRKTYYRFWQWSDGVLNEALLNRRLWTAFGWQLHVTDAPNDRSLRNFPIQGNGAEMMRLASIRLVADGIRVCAPVHDAFVIEAPLAELDEAIVHTQDVMRWASAQVLEGFELASDFKVVRNPDRYMDERGSRMWNDVMGQLDRIDLKALDSYPV